MMAMFCPYCNRNIKDNEIFCPYCGKAQTQKNAPNEAVEPMEPKEVETTEPEVMPSKSAKKQRISFTAVKAIITVILVVVLLIVVLQIYYPSVFPWNH
jgi:uncharacterized Zn finger protein (UPF0148 family)